MFDVSKIKPGWSLSKVKRYLPEAGGCPLRFAKLDIEGRWNEEPKGEAAGIGTVLAAMMAFWRQVWLEHGSDASAAHVNVESVGKKAAAEEGISDKAVEQAFETFFDKIPREYGARIRPARDRVARYWIEERIALTRDWARLTMRPQDAKWWGSKEQREKTWFRLVPDFAWLDIDGVLHVEDDKALWGKVDQRQVQSYAFALDRVLASEGVEVQGIECRYNLIGQGKVLDVPASDLADVAGFPAWLKAATDRILADREFLPHIGKSCDWCGFQGECPAYQKVGTEIATTSPGQFRVPATLEEAEKLGLWIMVGEAVVAAAKKAAREWVEGHGSVALPGTDKELRLTPQRSLEAPAGQVLGALVEAGVSKEAILERISLKPGDVDDVLKGVWPLSGKGVTADVKAAHRAERERVLGLLADAWEEKPRAPLFGVFARKDEG